MCVCMCVCVYECMCIIVTYLSPIGELNYHQFLYPNASDVRKLMMWLVDAMPKKTIESAGGPAGLF